MTNNNFLIFIFLLFLSGTASCQNRENENFQQKQERAMLNSDNADYSVNSSVPAGLDFRPAARIATRGVVNIQATAGAGGEGDMPPEFYRNLPREFREYFEDQFRQRPRRGMQVGSGVIVSDDGYIVTNNHVIANSEVIQVTLYDNRQYQARIIGTDPATDLALIKIEETNLNFIPFGRAEDVEVGDWVLAVGNPFNLASTVTAGIVSAKARNIGILRDQAAIESFIQTDAAVNPGNSGGALVDLNGRLIGINTAIATPTGTFAGYSFAVPVNITQKVINDILRYGEVRRGYLGIYIRDMNAQIAEHRNISATRGVFIDSVIIGSGAAAANLQNYDVIVEMDGRTINTVPEMQEVIGSKGPGDRINIVIVRGSRRMNVAATLQRLQD